MDSTGMSKLIRVIIDTPLKEKVNKKFGQTYENMKEKASPLISHGTVDFISLS